MALTRNVGGWDRAIRVIVGFALMALVLFGNLSRVLMTAAFLVGAIALITGVLRYCPINRMLGVDTANAQPMA